MNEVFSVTLCDCWWQKSQDEVLKMASANGKSLVSNTHEYIRHVEEC